MLHDQLQPWPADRPPEPALCGEDARASILATYGIDALQDDPELGEITQFAAALCQAPIAMVSLVESERQRFLTTVGLEERDTPRPTSFCAHAMLSPKPMVVPDAADDDRFESNPLVTGQPHIRFYAGAPLISHEGAPLGSLCVIDTKPRPDGLTDIQMQGLQVLAASVMRRLRHRREQIKQDAKIERNARDLRTLIDTMPQIAFSITDDGTFNYFNARFYERIGDKAPQDAEDWRLLVHPDGRDAIFDDWYERFAKKQRFDAEYRMKQRDGSWRWVLSRVIPARPDSDGPTGWFGTITDIDDNHREAEARELLSRELSHRIKNIFAVISGLVSLKAREYPEADAFADDISETLQALNRAHSYVTQEQNNAKDTLQGLIEKLMRPYGDRGGARFSLEGDTVPVSARSATPLALVFHELATNSAKYGSLSAAKGHVAIVIKRHEDEVCLEWKETGGPPPKGKRGNGFGSRLVERSVSSQLSGTLKRSFEVDGMSAVLTVPLTAL